MKIRFVYVEHHPIHGVESAYVCITANTVPECIMAVEWMEKLVLPYDVPHFLGDRLTNDVCVDYIERKQGRIMAPGNFEERYGRNVGRTIKAESPDAHCLEEMMLELQNL
jgi:hypothetical protein